MNRARLLEGRCVWTNTDGGGSAVKEIEWGRGGDAMCAFAEDNDWQGRGLQESTHPPVSLSPGETRQVLLFVVKEEFACFSVNLIILFYFILFFKICGSKNPALQTHQLPD